MDEEGQKQEFEHRKSSLEELLSEADELLDGEDRIDHALQGKGKLDDISYPIPPSTSQQNEAISYEGISTFEEVSTSSGFIGVLKRIYEHIQRGLYGDKETITHHQPGLIEQGTSLSEDLASTVALLKKDLSMVQDNLEMKAQYHENLAKAVSKAEITYTRLEGKMKGMAKISARLQQRLNSDDISLQERAEIAKRLRVIESRQRVATSHHDIYAETLNDQYSQLDYLEQEKELDQEQLTKAQKEIYKLDSMAAEVSMRAQTSFAEAKLPQLLEVVSNLEGRIVGFHQQIHDARIAQSERFREVYGTTQTSHNDEQVEGLSQSRKQYVDTEVVQRNRLHNRVKERLYKRQEESDNI